MTYINLIKVKYEIFESEKFHQIIRYSLNRFYEICSFAKQAK